VQGECPSLKDYLLRCKELLRELSLRNGLEDLSHLKYHTLALSRVLYKTRKGEERKRYQLKAYYTEGKRQKSKTLLSWREGEVPEELKEVVYLYRGTKHLQRAVEYLKVFEERNFLKKEA